MSKKLSKTILFAFLAIAAGTPIRSTASPQTPPAAAGAAAAPVAERLSIIDLQPFRTSSTAAILTEGHHVHATLTNLNPAINRWYLLSVDTGQNAARCDYHLENATPQLGTLSLTTSVPTGLAIRVGDAGEPCPIWDSSTGSPLESARRTRLPEAPLCRGSIYLRNLVSGRRSAVEQWSDYLRDHVWGGEQMIAYAKSQTADRYAETEQPHPNSGATARLTTPGAPTPAEIEPAFSRLALNARQLELRHAGDATELVEGQWYRLLGTPDAFVSAITPDAIRRHLLDDHDPHVNALDTLEAKSIAYLVAFDLDHLDLHFVMGTDHPRLNWSSRAPRAPADSALLGPDGIDDPAPLVPTGIVSVWDTRVTAATFAGGFKREHGAFHFGPMALHNQGTHYGFIEEGVVFSRLNAGLSTVLVMQDGYVDLRAWQATDSPLLKNIRYARQNGVPLIQFDPARGVGVPGALVNDWGRGNWSGSVKEDLRTLRAGLCLLTQKNQRFLVYGYFSDATPSGMARVFQAYHCRDAMHLDMNALEHTYLAIYSHGTKGIAIEHLIVGMASLDRDLAAGPSPRFLVTPDNRDFFYFTRRVER